MKNLPLILGIMAALSSPTLAQWEDFVLKEEGELTPEQSEQIMDAYDRRIRPYVDYNDISDIPPGINRVSQGDASAYIKLGGNNAPEDVIWLKQALNNWLFKDSRNQLLEETGVMDERTEYVIKIVQQSETYPSWDEATQTVVELNPPLTGVFDCRTAWALVFALRGGEPTPEEAMGVSLYLQREMESGQYSQ